MENLKTLNEARHIAKELLNQAKENEPNITADLQTIALQVSAEMIGSENKFKSQESLTRKLIAESYDDLRKIPKKAKTINDVLRYTFVLPIQNYFDNVHQTIERLRNLGYRVPEHKTWNAWRNVGSDKDRGYRGINTTIISSQNQKFELQFHTKASFELKTETHDLYKEARLTETLPERREEIKEIVLVKAERIEIPKGVG